ncbi:hypothetical protein ACLB1S_15140 [Escherichia coli]
MRPLPQRTRRSPVSAIDEKIPAPTPAAMAHPNAVASFDHRNIDG